MKQVGANDCYRFVNLIKCTKNRRFKILTIRELNINMNK